MLRFSPSVAIVSVIAGLISARLDAQQLPPCWLGKWEPAFDHGGNAPSGPSACNTSYPFPLADFNAVHASLIPKGDRRGWLIVWPESEWDDAVWSGPRTHMWSLIDPVNKVFENYCVALPVAEDLFCAGHVWTAEGDLLVFGGSKCHGGSSACPTGGPGGSTLCYLWQPPLDSVLTPGGTWIPQPNLDDPRWYPSGLALGAEPSTDKDWIMIAGGTDRATTPGGNRTVRNSYQVWIPPSGPPFVGTYHFNSSQGDNTFDGPFYSETLGIPGALNIYPRLHLLSAPGGAQDLARVFHSGMEIRSDRISHYLPPFPPAWLGTAWLTNEVHVYGSNVLLPILGGGLFKDHVLMVGGLDTTTDPWVPTDVVERANASTTNPTISPWVSGSSVPSTTTNLGQRRAVLNTVLLPDTRVLAVGGESEFPLEGCSEVPALVPEIYDDSQPPGSQWRLMASHSIIRDYHSTALLLPSGKVISAGGEYRRYLAEGLGGCASPTKTPRPPGATDYQVFVPDYLFCGNPRPIIEGLRNSSTGQLTSTLNYNGEYTITYTGLPEGVIISKVTLLRPGSVTHHSDNNQRCVGLSLMDSAPTIPASVKVKVPSKNSGILPRGFYMMFLVSSQTVSTQGVPSAALWVDVRGM